LVPATALRRSRAGLPASTSVTSTHRPAALPRPTRPRSWCSWLTPKRSASSTTITVALGTSTPTSITVVATSTSSSPGRSAHRGVLVLRRQPPVQRAEPQPGSGPSASSGSTSSTAAAGAGPGRPRARLLRVADPRADDERLAPAATSSRTFSQVRSSAGSPPGRRAS
jgi:hypothetical protein